MKVKILTSVAGLNFAYAENEIVDIDKEIAKDLIQAKHAEEIKKGKR